MQYTPRTLIRHLLILALLIAVTVRLAPDWLNWVSSRLLFLCILFALAIVIGFAAHWLTTRRMIARQMLRLYAAWRGDARAIRPPLPAFLRPLKLWGACSRCVSWWCGGFAGFFAAMINGFTGESTWLSWLFYAAVSAEVAAAIAIAAFLFDRTALPEAKSVD